MPRILGLDLGTNSIGWAIVDYDRHFSPDSQSIDNFKLAFDENNKPLHGVLIFSEGVKIEKGNESSKAAERTGYRSARRIKFRRKLRKYETLKVLEKYNLCPIRPEELHKWKKSKNPTTGKAENFRHYPDSKNFIDWIRTDNQPEKSERKKQTKNPYALRDLASKKKLDRSNPLEAYLLGRVFYHFAQRRGFLSSRLDTEDLSIVEEQQPILDAIIQDAPSTADLLRDFDDYFDGFDKTDEREKQMLSLKRAFDKIIKENTKETHEIVQSKLLERLYKKADPGKVKKGIEDLSNDIEANGYETMGQYFYQLYKDGNPIRRRYTGREEHYRTEFEHICQVQQLPDAMKQELERALFYQRPLRSQKGLVGRCTMEPSKPRCPVSHPDFEEYRMWQQLNQIKYKLEDGNWENISMVDRLKIAPKFLRKSKPTFEFGELISFLGDQRTYNYKPRQSMTGCPTTAALVSIFGQEWKQGIAERCATDFKSKKDASLKTLEELANDVWHVLFTFDKNEMLVKFANEKLGLNEKEAKQFSGIRLKKDYASLSRNAVVKILPFLKEGLLVSHAVFCANLGKIVKPELWTNQDDRNTIVWGIKQVMDDYKSYRELRQLVNGLLKDQRDENAKYSELAKSEYEKAVLEKLEAHFGKKTWAERPDQSQILQEVSKLFFTQFKKDFGRGEFLSIDRLDQKINQFLLDNGFCENEDLLLNMYHPSDIETFKPAKNEKKDGRTYLGSPMTNSVRNPMAMRSLHQLRQLVNTLIEHDQIDEYTHVHIELARELNDANKRKAIQHFQREREAENKNYKEEIQTLYRAECGKEAPTPTSTDIMKYRLWLEQGKACLYTGHNIGICDFIGGNPKFDIEHTIPRSQCSDNSLMNKTLCEIKFNREVKRNQMPSQLGNHDEILLNLEKLEWGKKVAELDYRIEKLKRATKAATTKEDKDKKIEERHYLTLHRDYLKGKLDRFNMTEIKAGFKNSQLVDTGIITKYSSAFLKTRFKRVESTKGELVAAFREAWGLQEAYEKKDRSNHIHHGLDAITIACMTKPKYDLLAQAWSKEEEGNEKPQQEDYFKKQAKEILAASKPWPTFVEDLKVLEQGVLIAHHTPDQMPKQTVKKLRIRGKIAKDAAGKPIYQRGDTVRGSMHLDTVFGAINKPKKNDSNQFIFSDDQKIELELDADGNPQVFYVVRRSLESLKKGEIDCIVDEVVQQKVKEAIETGVMVLTADGQANKFPNDGKVWMNEAKGIEIKKVRVYAKAGRGFLSNPIHLKAHRDVSKHEHKRMKYVQNDENYALAIYEQLNDKGKRQRDWEIVSVKDAGEYYRLSNNEQKTAYPLVPETHIKKGFPLKALLKKGTMALFYENSPDEIKGLTQRELVKRLYKVARFDNRPRVALRHHQVAKPASEVEESSQMNFDTPPEQLSLGISNLNILVEGIDFWLEKTGHICFEKPTF